VRTFLRLLGFLRPHLPRVALAGLLGVATVASNVGLLATAAYVIAAATLVPLLGYLVLPSYLVRLFGISRAGARYTERMVSHDLTFRLLADLRTAFYRRLEPLAPARLLRHRSGDLLSRVVKDVEELENVYLRVVSPVAVAAVVALITSLIFYTFDPVLSLAALGFLVATGVGVPLLVGRLSRGLGRRQLELRGELDAKIVDNVQGVQDILAFGRQDDREEEIAALNRRLDRVQERMAFVTGLQDALSDLMMNLAMVAVLALAIPLVAAGEIRGVYLAFLALVMLGSFEAVQPLGKAFQFLGRSVNAGERLFEIVDAEPEVTDPPAPLPAPTDRTLRFEDVTFRYERDAPPVLQDISFTLEPGKRVAVVGPSGAGKSTLADLLLRFWDPTSGRITLGGRDLRDLAQTHLRELVGVVSQDTHVFTDTLRGNLLVAKPEATDADLRRALARAHLSDWPRPPGRARHPPRRAGSQALGRRAPAPLHRPRAPQGRAHPRPRRAHRQPGSRDGGRGAGGRLRAHAGPRHARHHPQARADGGGGRDPGPRPWAHRRARDARRARERSRSLPGVVRGTARGALRVLIPRAGRPHEPEAALPMLSGRSHLRLFHSFRS
jgi:ATP-binding cassette subfamily C protein CydC